MAAVPPAASKRGKRPSPFEDPNEAPWRVADTLQVAIGSVILLPVIRAVLSITIAALGALWCLLVAGVFGLFEACCPLAPWALKLKLAVLRLPQQYLTRLWLLVLGFWWVRIEGCPPCCPSAICGDMPKVIVTNHTTFIDVLVMVWQQMPSFLAKEGVFQIPFIGTVGRVNQMIGVARSSVEGRAITKKRVLEHIASPHTPPLLIFPEGTTSRNDSIIQFKAGGAFAAGVAVQPVLLRYYPCWCSTFDMSNTPGQNTKNWALRLLCAPWHSLVVTYLPPVVPDPAMQADSVLFANAVRSAMAEGMGPDAQISNQSYDEFFLWKLGREELKLPSSVLRTLEFKPAAAAVAESGGSAVGALTLERAKATMRGYDEAYRETTKAKAAASGQTELDPLVANQERERAGGEADRGGGVSADGFARALGFDSAGAPEAAAAWSAVVAAAGLGDDVGASLDFQQFLIGFQRAQPAPALAKGWLEPTEGAGDDTRV